MGVVQTVTKKQTDNFSAAQTYNAASAFTVGNQVVVHAVHFGTASSISCTIAGTAATVDSEVSDGPNASLYYFRATVANSGRTDIVITPSGATNNYVTCGAEEWDNFVASPVDQTGTSNNASSSTAPSVTSAGATTQADEVVYAMYMDTFGSSTVSVTPPAGYTESWEETDGLTHQSGSCAYRVVNATGSQTATFALGAAVGSNRTAMITYKLAATSSNVPRAMHGYRLRRAS